MAKGKVILSGVTGHSKGVAIGVVHIVDYESPKSTAAIKPGEIWVSERTIPDNNKDMEKAAAFIANSGGFTSHTNIMAAAMGKPSVTGTVEAMSVLKDGQMVVVDADNGEVYEYLPEGGTTVTTATAAPAKKSLAERMAELAAKSGKQLSPELLEKMKKRGM